MKLAAIEAMWETEPPPASFTVFGLPDIDQHTTRSAIRLPWMLGLIATRSLDTAMPGIGELVQHGEERIRSGIIAYTALATLRQNRGNAAAQDAFAQHGADLGYAFLLKRYVSDVATASPQQIHRAAIDLIPDVPVMFWSFRFMVGLGFYFIAVFALAFVLASWRKLEQRWFLRIALLSLPLPWIAVELGWVVAEYGRQPWVVEGVLPTFMGVSSTSVAQVTLSLAGFVLFYSTLAVIDVYLLVKYIRQGPPLMPGGIDHRPVFAASRFAGED
jgi:cytochrome bd ubiquinol oxidase subunit I